VNDATNNKAVDKQERFSTREPSLQQENLLYKKRNISTEENLFVKPNGQNRACSSYAMARKGAMKENILIKTKLEGVAEKETKKIINT